MELEIKNKPIFKFEHLEDKTENEAIGRHTIGRFLEVKTSRDDKGNSFEYLVLENPDGTQFILSVRNAVNKVKDALTREAVKVGDQLKFTLTELRDTGKPSKQKIVKVETMED